MQEDEDRDQGEESRASKQDCILYKEFNHDTPASTIAATRHTAHSMSVYDFLFHL